MAVARRQDERQASNRIMGTAECFTFPSPFTGTKGHLLGMNVAAGAWRLGLANVMLHGRDAKSCAKLKDAGFSNVTCVWSERAWFPHRNGKYHIFEAGTPAVQACAARGQCTIFWWQAKL